jgi:hypothetical protein
VREAHERLEDLLLERAIRGLDAEQDAELARLLAEHPDVDAETYERAAAVVCLASLDVGTRMPEHLRRELTRQGLSYVESARVARR